MRRHRAEHTSKRHTCGQCGKEFVFQSSLDGHMMSHTAEKSFLCPEWDCDKAFQYQRDLIRHLEAHEGKIYQCKGYEGCSKTFTNKHNLQDHIAVNHIGLTCPNPGCQEVFHSRHARNDHYAVCPHAPHGSD